MKQERNSKCESNRAEKEKGFMQPMPKIWGKSNVIIVIL